MTVVNHNKLYLLCSRKWILVYLTKSVKIKLNINKVDRIRNDLLSRRNYTTSNIYLDQFFPAASHVQFRVKMDVIIHSCADGEQRVALRPIRTKPGPTARCVPHAPRRVVSTNVCRYREQFKRDTEGPGNLGNLRNGRGFQSVKV